MGARLCRDTVHLSHLSTATPLSPAPPFRPSRLPMHSVASLNPGPMQPSAAPLTDARLAGKQGAHMSQARRTVPGVASPWRRRIRAACSVLVSWAHVATGGTNGRASAARRGTGRPCACESALASSRHPASVAGPDPAQTRTLGRRSATADVGKGHAYFRLDASGRAGCGRAQRRATVAPFASATAERRQDRYETTGPVSHDVDNHEDTTALTFPFHLLSEFVLRVWISSVYSMTLRSNCCHLCSQWRQ